MTTTTPKLSHDGVTKVLFDQIVSGIQAIEDANKVLLAEEEAGAGLREIDKALKENKHGNKKVSDAWTAAQAAHEAYKKAVTEARNLYRVDVLKEEAKETPDTDSVDKDAVKETRALVMKSIDLMVTYAAANGKTDIVEWANNVSVPQVGRKGESVVGQKKPRAQVKVGDNLYESFGEAAKQVSTELSKNGNKVNYVSGDLVAAWEAAGGKPEFEFHGLTLKVIPKETKKAAEAEKK